MHKFRILHGAAVNTTRSGHAQICCIDVTTSCANNDAINACVFVDVMLFIKGNMIFPGIFREDKCYSARYFIKRVTSF